MSFEHPCPCCRYYTVCMPRCHEQCPICGWTDSGAYNDEGSVWLDQAQRNFRDFGSCSIGWRDGVTPPTPAVRRAPPPFTIDEWKQESLVQLVGRAREVFAEAPRPRQFTSRHCDECIDHDETMKSFDNETLTPKVLENPGWDPRCFLTPEAFRYFMPGLVRIQIEVLQPSAASSHGWLDVNLLDFHLRDAEDLRFSHFTPGEVRFVAELYHWVLRGPGFDRFIGTDRLASAAESWRARAARLPKE